MREGVCSERVVELFIIVFYSSENSICCIFDRQKIFTMAVNYLSDDNGDTIAVQISIDEWNQLIEKYPDIEAGQKSYDIPQSQKDEVLRRKKYYEEHENELLTWEEVKKRLTTA